MRWSTEFAFRWRRNKIGAESAGLNVDQGLQDVTLSDWKKSSKISAHAHNYLNDSKRKREIKKFVAGLAGIMPGSEAQVGRTAPAVAGAAESGEDEPHDAQGAGVSPSHAFSRRVIPVRLLSKRHGQTGSERRTPCRGS